MPYRCTSRIGGYDKAAAQKQRKLAAARAGRRIRDGVTSWQRVMARRRQRSANGAGTQGVRGGRLLETSENGDGLIQLVIRRWRWVLLCAGVTCWCWRGLLPVLSSQNNNFTAQITAPASPQPALLCPLPTSHSSRTDKQNNPQQSAWKNSRGFAVVRCVLSRLSIRGGATAAGTD